MDNDNPTPQTQAAPETGTRPEPPGAWEASIENALTLALGQIDALTIDVHKIQAEVLKLGGRVNTLMKERRK